MKKKEFHKLLKKMCNDIIKIIIQNIKNGDKYFYLTHRKEPRGIGGIFLIIKKIILKKILNLSRCWNNISSHF